MAKEYFEMLSHLIEVLNLDAEISLPMAVKHFLAVHTLRRWSNVCLLVSGWFGVQTAGGRGRSTYK